VSIIGSEVFSHLVYAHVINDIIDVGLYDSLAKYCDIGDLNY